MSYPYHRIKTQLRLGESRECQIRKEELEIQDPWLALAEPLISGKAGTRSSCISCFSSRGAVHHPSTTSFAGLQPVLRELKTCPDDTLGLLIKGQESWLLIP